MNGKGMLKAIGFMAAGSALTLIELVRELLNEKDGQRNRDAMRLMLDGVENGTLEVTSISRKGVGFRARTSNKYESCTVIEEDASE